MVGGAWAIDGGMSVGGKGKGWCLLKIGRGGVCAALSYAGGGGGGVGPALFIHEVTVGELGRPYIFMT